MSFSTNKLFSLEVDSWRIHHPTLITVSLLTAHPQYDYWSPLPHTCAIHIHAYSLITLSLITLKERRLVITSPSPSCHVQHHLPRPDTRHCYWTQRHRIVVICGLQHSPLTRTSSSRILSLHASSFSVSRLSTDSELVLLHFLIRFISNSYSARQQ